jgi:hypothetical protein
MTSGDHYRLRAANFEVKSKNEFKAELRTEYQSLAAFYRRLAQMADQNEMTDIVYEPPPPRPHSD